MSDVNESNQFSDRENFLAPNYSKIAVQGDWNCKIYQNVWNLGCFWKKWWLFLNKNEFAEDSIFWQNAFILIKGIFSQNRKRK